MRRLIVLLAVSLFSLSISPSAMVHPFASEILHTTGSLFTSATLDDAARINLPSDGDLWPSCWADDDALYAANGDGRGFNWLALTHSDVVVSRISGDLPALSGTTLATSDNVGQIWNTSGRYNRKPTGMICVNGALYLAVQDLSLDYNDAPNATIARSTDHGLTWTWDTRAPMFHDHRFTTIMFLDYGRDSVANTDGYVYAYGLDYNWRDSNTHVVPDPVDLYLARVPQNAILDRAQWMFYSGAASHGVPRWTAQITEKASILHTDAAPFGQGGIVYDQPLNRYLFSTWSQFSFEFYEAPQPWGPWQHFLSRSFGPYPWTAARHGGYGTTLPSKFISADGQTLWLQSNVCPCGGAGVSVYGFSLRRLTLSLAQPS